MGSENNAVIHQLGLLQYCRAAVLCMQHSHAHTSITAFASMIDLESGYIVNADFDFMSYLLGQLPDCCCS